MRKRDFLTLSAFSALSLALPAKAQHTATEGEPKMASTSPETGYADINGLKMYHEIHGSGEPLILLHGGITVVDIVAATLPELAKTRRVVVPHMQGHGLTKDIERPLSSEQMSDDVAALMTHLGIEQADVVGYSMGGGVAMQVAFRHPERVRKLGIVSATFARDGWYPDVVQAFLDMPTNAATIAPQVANSPLAAMFPDVDWETLFRKVGKMAGAPFDWGDKVSALAMPTMLVFGDADAVTPEHVVDFYQRLGGFQRDGGLDGSGRPKGRLAIMPNATHYNLNETPAVGQAISDFLNAP